MVTIFMSYLMRSGILHNAHPKPVLSWGACYIYLILRSDSDTVPELYLRFYSYVCVLYNGVCIYMFVNVIQSSCWLYLILGILSYISYVWVIIPLYYCYINNSMNMFVNSIYMFTTICWCNS